MYALIIFTLAAISILLKNPLIMLFIFVIYFIDSMREVENLEILKVIFTMTLGIFSITYIGPYFTIIIVLSAVYYKSKSKKKV